MLFAPQLFKKDFKIPPVHSDIHFNPNWEMSPSEDLLKILGQPFFYYSKGNQFTVFLSEDKEYVLKLFRYKTSLFPILQKMKNLFTFKGKPRNPFWVKTQKTLSAAHLACNEGRDFTGGVYCHLNLSQEPFLPKISLQIKNRRIQLPLDNTRFVLQKKAENFKEAFLKAKDDPQKILKYIDSFASLIVNRSHKNIRNSDPNIAPNFGFLKERAVEIDFGNYQKVNRRRDQQIAEISSYMKRLEEFLSKYGPEYAEYAKQLRIKTEISYDPIE